MTHRYHISADGALLRDGCELSYRTWTWTPSAATSTVAVDTARAALQAVAATHSLRHLVVGVIGPREATPAQYETAEAIGRALGALGVATICGGKTGVMEAVCRGVAETGGLAIGVLPGDRPEEANAFVGVPLPTGLNEARNMVIAKAARALIAVGGSYGTLTEVAYGLHFGKTVIGLENAPAVAGVAHAATVDDAIELAAQALIGAAGVASDAEPAR